MIDNLNSYVKVRLDICKQCPNLTMGVCRKCGCFVNLKTALKSSSCPIDKWKEEVDDKISSK